MLWSREDSRQGSSESTGRYAKLLLTVCTINFMRKNRDKIGKRLQYVLQEGKTHQENGLGAKRTVVKRESAEVIGRSDSWRYVVVNDRAIGQSERKLNIVADPRGFHGKTSKIRKNWREFSSCAAIWPLTLGPFGHGSSRDVSRVKKISRGSTVPRTSSRVTVDPRRMFPRVRRGPKIARCGGGSA